MTLPHLFKLCIKIIVVKGPVGHWRSLYFSDMQYSGLIILTWFVPLLYCTIILKALCGLVDRKTFPTREDAKLGRKRSHLHLIHFLKIPFWPHSNSTFFDFLGTMVHWQPHRARKTWFGRFFRDLYLWPWDNWTNFDRSTSLQIKGRDLCWQSY